MPDRKDAPADKRRCRTPFPGRSSRFAAAAFIFVWFGFLAAVFAMLAFERRAHGRLIATTPEYTCLAAGVRRVSVSWRLISNTRNSGHNLDAGTLTERQSTDCVPDGDAVTYVVVSGGGLDTLLRVPGRHARAVTRLGDWPDVTNEDGTRRWRNDGVGYHKIPR